MAAAALRVNSASMIGCSTPLLAIAMSPTSTVTTSIGMPKPEFARRANTCDGA